MNRQNILMVAMAALVFGALELSTGTAEAQCPWGAQSVSMNAATAPGTFETGVWCSDQSNTFFARAWMSSFFFTNQWAARTLAARRATGGCGGLNETNLGILIIGNVINFNTGAFAFHFRQQAAPTCTTTVSRSWSILSNTGWIQGACHVGVGAGCATTIQS